MGGSAGDGDGLHGVALVQPVQAVPEPDAAAEHDRHLHDVQVVDEVGGQELVDGGRSAGVPLTKWNVVSPTVSGSRS